MWKWLTGIAVLVLIVAGVWKATSKPVDKDSRLKIQDSIEVTEKDWVRGKKDAPITIVEYGDFQCPSCGAYYPVLKELEAIYEDKLRVVYREFPLTTIHKHAWEAAVSAESAGLQGKFWEMHDLLFENQDEWTKTGKIEEYASGLKLDMDKFKAGKAGVENKVRADQNTGVDLGVTGTPTFFVNGQKIGLPGGVEEFKVILDGELAKRPAPTVAEKVHMHFDIAVYVDGKKIDLSGGKYMEKNEAVHLHDNNGEVAHIHQKGATLGVFIDSLELRPDSGVMVNGNLMKEWRDYEPKDLDRIAFGNGPVTDKACIYSEKCPERGKPPTEECVGGLNTPCE